MKAGAPPSQPGGPALSAALPGARSALVLLLCINLFNYIDRYVLAAVVPQIKNSFFGPDGAQAGAGLNSLLAWSEQHLGFKPENALVGVLSMAFMVMYMIGAPVFGRLAERRSRWLLVGIEIGRAHV
jgi:MFS family permease